MRLPVAILLVAALHVAFFGDVILDGRTLSPASHTSGLTPKGPYEGPVDPPSPAMLDVEGAAWVDEPSPVIARRLLDDGSLPLWNGAEGFGTPFAANLNSGAASPLSAPLNLVPGPAAADAFYLARLALLGVSTWIYLGTLGVGGLARLTGMAVVAYGGYALAWIVHHPLSAELFLPLVLTGVELGRRGRAGGWMLVAVATALSLLGGKLQASLLCAVFAGVYALARARAVEGGAGMRTTVAAGLCLALGAALAAVLLVPASELVQRASGLTIGARAGLAAYTLAWPTLASVVTPRLFAPAGAFWPGGLPLPPGIGLVATLLAFVAVVARASPLHGIARILALWVAVLLLRNVGMFGSVVWASLPGVGAILFLKYTFTIAFALAVLAALGVDALQRGLVPRRRVVAVAVTLLAGTAFTAAAALVRANPPAFAGGLAAGWLPAALAAVAVVLWSVRRVGHGVAAALLVLASLAELHALAPDRHPVRVDPYRPPPFVDFLRGAAPGRVIAAADILTPLTSAAAGLDDVRAIDVLTPGAYYAFFTRLLSFCPRLIHFTVDPDLALAATAPALDLAGVRWVVSPGPLATEDLPARVARQVENERLARFFSGLRALAVDPARLALGPVGAAGTTRWAFTLEAPTTLAFTATSEAPFLAWEAYVLKGDVRVRWRLDGAENGRVHGTEGLDADGAWHPRRVLLGRPGAPRTIRARLVVEGDPGARVAFGSLGFAPDAGIEEGLVRTRTARHEAELAALVPAFHDRGLDVMVYENRNVMPRAFRVARAERAESLDGALERLGDGFEFRRAALVTGADVGLDGGADEATGTATIVTATPTHVEVATDGPGPALVVLTDLAFPGWEATVDDRHAPLLTVDGVFRGVAVAAGSHRVHVRYRPRSWLVGALLSVLAAAVLVPASRGVARLHRRSGFGTRPPVL